MVGFQASFSDCSIPRLCRLLLCNLSRPSCYSSPQRRYHMSSSAHLGVPRLQPSIFACHTRSFANLGVYRLCPSMSNYQPALPLPPGSYCMEFSSLLLLLLASREISRVDRSCFSVASWRHQASLLRPPPLRTLFTWNTLKIVDLAPPTVPRLPVVSLCKSSPTAFPLPPIRLPPQASPTPRLLIASLASP